MIIGNNGQFFGEPAVPLTGTFTQVGNPFALTGFILQHMAGFQDGSRVALVAESPNILNTYYFDETNWAIEGTGVVAGGGTQALGQGNTTTTRVFYIQAGVELLKAFKYTASVWAQEGNSLGATGNGIRSLVGLTDTFMVMWDPNTDSIRGWNFDGTNFTLSIHTPFVIVGTDTGAVARLNDTDFVMAIQGQSTLFPIRTNVGSFSNLGNAYNVGFIGQRPALCELTPNYFVGYFEAIGKIQLYHWDGTDITPVGAGLTTGGSRPRLATMSGSRIAFTSTSNELVCYDVT